MYCRILCLVVLIHCNARGYVTGAGKNSKVGVEGDSAGGKLAASVAHDVEGLAFQVIMAYQRAYVAISHSIC